MQEEQSGALKNFYVCIYIYTQSICVYVYIYMYIHIFLKPRWKNKLKIYIKKKTQKKQPRDFKTFLIVCANLHMTVLNTFYYCTAP